MNADSFDYTPEERAAYERGYEDGRRCSGIEWLQSVNDRIAEHQRRIRAAIGSDKA